MNKFNQKTKKGFTLIELMVVIAIIGVLSAVAVPIILTVQRDSRDSTRLKQLDAIRIGATSYWSEYVTDVDVYTDSTCKTSVPSAKGNSDKQSTTETTTYYVCSQGNSLGDTKKTAVTLTANYMLLAASGGDVCTNPADNSHDKVVIFAINRGKSGSSTGKLVLCTEGGASKELEYKQQ